jgi:hypothetical protein
MMKVNYKAKRLLITITMLVAMVITGCGKPKSTAPVENPPPKTDSPAPNLRSKSSEKATQQKEKEKDPAGEHHERREWKRIPNDPKSVVYDYTWRIGKEGEIIARRLEFNEPISRSDAKRLAREVVPNEQRGKLLKTRDGDIGYPGATGHMETYENYEITYRINQGRVWAIRIYPN